jgi:hypothetical protein
VAFRTAYWNIANFDDARLVRKSEAKDEFIGTTAGDYAAARKMCSLSAPEAIFASASRMALSFPFAV